ncbi:helix-turn-helix transcriptional regulator [Streptomyces sp.]|uniref:helix-turn-helix domain-containing protein n=1 Tax=Streptomyces sp. TaxID=1931 RepID=UPI00281267DB|nr:helix-turn-helix transcriptional regulator [Streptomyces sp.]
MASLNVGSLGEYLREQRRSAQLSLRQLADAAGVSNPYLSQIERGLRKPSAEVLQQVAKALRISAETLYVRAGILDAERDRDEVETTAVLLADPTLTERQKQVLLQIYESFRKENGFVAGPRDAERVQDEQGGDEAPGGAPGGARDDVLDGVRGDVPVDVREDALDDSSIRGPRAADARTRKTGGDDAAPRRTAG